MARVNQITGILKGKHGAVRLRSLARSRSVSRQDVLYLYVLVLEEAIGSFGLRPIATGLIDRTLGHLGKVPTELNESCRPSFIPQVHALKFFPCPLVGAAHLHPSLLKV